MVQEITGKASGVFLWVIPVVSSLLEGLRDGDDPIDLWRRIYELPSDLEDVFKKILADLSPRYSREACEMFQLAVTATDPVNVLEMSFALDGPRSALTAPFNMMAQNEIDYRSESMRRRVVSRSKGLLEVHTSEQSQEKAWFSTFIELLEIFSSAERPGLTYSLVLQTLNHDSCFPLGTCDRQKP
jgi:hypothetical protein